MHKSKICTVHFTEKETSHCPVHSRGTMSTTQSTAPGRPWVPTVVMNYSTNISVTPADVSSQQQSQQPTVGWKCLTQSRSQARAAQARSHHLSQINCSRKCRPRILYLLFQICLNSSFINSTGLTSKWALSNSNVIAFRLIVREVCYYAA